MAWNAETADAALVQAAQAGDARALQVLLAKHAPRIGRFAAKMCRSPSEAEDVVQDTLLAAMRTLPGFRGQAQVSTWLYQIARSFCIKKRRRTRSVIQGDAAIGDEESAEMRALASADIQADERLDQAQLGQAVQQAMDKLAPMYREVLLLRDVEGLTAPEVADALGLKIEAVKSRLHRARLAVRAEVAPLLQLPAETPAELQEEQEPVPHEPCPDVLQMYSRHLEGDISSNVCRQMEEHLRHCPKCNGTCDSLRRTLALCGASRESVPVATQFMVRRALGRVFGGSALTDPGGSDDAPARS